MPWQPLNSNGSGRQGRRIIDYCIIIANKNKKFSWDTNNRNIEKLAPLISVNIKEVMTIDVLYF